MQRIYLKVVLNSGYAAEDICVGDVNSYASADIRQRQAALETEFASSETVTFNDYEHNNVHVFKSSEIAYWELSAREWRNPRGW